MTSRTPRRYEPDYIKCECENDIFRVERVYRPEYPENRTNRYVNRFYAICTECGKAQQV